jgi:hypothetical protein
MCRGYLLLLALTCAAVLRTHAYEAVRDTQRGAALVSYLQASSAGLDEAQCRARIESLAATPYAFLRGTTELFYADMHDQVRARITESAFVERCSPQVHVSLIPPGKHPLGDTVPYTSVRR